ncbi:LCP family protein [Streptomyces pinistramenti]|uniref:LCP family protein n=1 Tax=Streptomyces pinistramenti TaxID=2884812 RepID=UPI001D082274|nr:LCP family protein [Streptomyces pinistramenti]MCB5911149.1 LCP family protein [Streptomyces pinistramenti]
MTNSPENPSDPENPDEGTGPTPQQPAPGTGAGPERTGAEPEGAEPGPGKTDADPGETSQGRPPRRRRRWPRWAALGVAVVLLALAGTGYVLYSKLNGNIRTDINTQAELEKYEAERPKGGPTDAENILLIGSDTRGDGNGAYGADNGTQRSDTAILLHLAAGRHRATAVSIPRDLMVKVPSCTRSDGKRMPAQTTQFNWAFQFAGAACTIRTVERMTGIRIDHHMIIDFVGFKKVVDAVHGVEVCVPRPIHDREARLDLPAGRQTLHGEDALGFVRVRKSLGNGSDTQRMERQQQFLGALVKKVQSNGVLLNPARLYPLLDAATSSLTTDKGLASLTGLYELVRSMRSIPADHVQFMTVPRREYRYDANRDELVQPSADRLFRRLAKDQPVSVEPPRRTAGGPDSDPSGDTPSPNASHAASSGEKAGSSPSPPGGSGLTFPGTTADRGICE